MILTQMRLQPQYNKARKRALAYQNQLEAEAKRAQYERRQKAAKAAAKASKASKVRPPKSPKSVPLPPRPIGGCTIRRQKKK